MSSQAQTPFGSATFQGVVVRSTGIVSPHTLKKHSSDVRTCRMCGQQFYDILCLTQHIQNRHGRKKNFEIAAPSGQEPKLLRLNENWFAKRSSIIHIINY
jgi:hypothetical protein